MNLTNLLIAFVVFSGIVIGLGEYSLDIQTIYNPPGNSTSAGNFTQFNETFTNVNTNLKNLSNHTAGVAKKSLWDPSKYYDVLLTMFDVGGIILELPGIFMNTITQAFSFMPFIPSWFKFVVIMVISIIVIMKLVGIFTKTGGEI